MRRALIFITLREWQGHKLRAAITLVSVAIGVATYFAVSIANQSLNQSFEETVDRMAGRATLQVTSEDAFPEDLIATVRSTAGVIGATDVLEQFCTIDTGGKVDFENAHRFLLFGVDPTGEQILRGRQPYGLTFLSIPGTVAISSVLADQEHVKAGDRMAILAPYGRSSLRVISVFKAEGIGELFGGRVAVMDIHRAQEALDLGRNVNRIDLITRPGVDIEPVRTDLKTRLPAGIDVERPRSRSQEVEDSTTLMRRALVLTSLVAMLVSSFLIFNAMSITVNQRWKQIGILRSLGVSQKSVRMSFLIEAVVIGLIGSALGLAVGYCLALESSRVTGGVSNLIWSTIVQVAVPVRPGFDSGFAAQSVLLGVVVAALSAWFPARAAGKIRPALALHNIEIRQTDLVVSKTRILLGAVLILGGFLGIKFTTALMGSIFGLAYFVLIFLGFVIILPGISYQIALALRPAAGRAFGSTGLLALDSIIHAPRRTSATVGAIMVGLAFVYSNWAMIKSERETVQTSFAQKVNFDLSVNSPASMSEDVVTKIASIPGVKNVDRSSSLAAHYRGQVAGTDATDLRIWFQRPGNTLVEGDYDVARNLVPKGDGVLISQNFAARWNLRLGDTLSLDTPTSKLERPILGIVDSNQWFEGTVLIDRALYKEYWRDSRTLHWLTLDLNQGADPDALKDQIERITSGPPLIAIPASELRKRGRDNISANIDHIFTFFYVQMFIAGFVGVVGIINTLVISVWDRRREIGIIRAVGGTRRQIALMVLLEGAALVSVGLLIGIVKGSIDTYFMIHTALRIFAGYSVPFYFPGAMILVSVPVVVAVALISATWPARLAAKTNVIDAIGSE
ncbi:MAG TPA: FtsX-like permease family protein [Blastocatellia bacterium]